MSYRAGFVGLIGQPNAGKSTLLNMLVKEKLSIVTAKPQTTRRRILGVVSRDQGQVVFVDAPGVLGTKTGLNAFLAKEARDVIQSSDVLIAVIGLDEKEKDSVLKILDLIGESKKPWFVVVTKTDLVAKKHRVNLIREMVEKIKPGTRILEISQQWGKDADSILEEVIKTSLSLLPQSPKPLYDLELFTPHSLRELAAEAIREKCFEELEQEIPYGLAVRITKFDESSPKIVKISADVLVAKENHKPIVIGKSAAHIKTIGTKARLEIEKLVDNKVFLELQVVVKPDWQENTRLMKDLGYSIEEE